VTLQGVFSFSPRCMLLLRSRADRTSGFEHEKAHFDVSDRICVMCRCRGFSGLYSFSIIK
jgi:hypothetical protein